MTVLSKTHIRLLKQIKKNKIVRTDKRKLEDVEYLRENGLVVAVTYDKPGDYYYQPRLTEKGKAILYEWKRTKRKSDITLLISICAFLLSVLTAFTPFEDWSQEIIGKIFKTLFSK